MASTIESYMSYCAWKWLVTVGIKEKKNPQGSKRQVHSRVVCDQDFAARLEDLTVTYCEDKKHMITADIRTEIYLLIVILHLTFLVKISIISLSFFYIQRAGSVCFMYSF